MLFSNPRDIVQQGNMPVISKYFTYSTPLSYYRPRTYSTKESNVSVEPYMSFCLRGR